MTTTYETQMLDDITVAIANDEPLYQMARYLVRHVPPEARGDAFQELVLASAGFDNPDLSPIVRQVFGSQGSEFWNRVAQHFTDEFSAEDVENTIDNTWDREVD